MGLKERREREREREGPRMGERWIEGVRGGDKRSEGGGVIEGEKEELEEV